MTGAAIDVDVQVSGWSSTVLLLRLSLLLEAGFHHIGLAGLEFTT